MLASRVGHDVVWLAIAGLFCLVEGAVKLTEISPRRLLPIRHAVPGGRFRAGRIAQPTAARAEAPEAFAQ